MTAAKLKKTNRKESDQKKAIEGRGKEYYSGFEQIFVENYIPRFVDADKSVFGITNEPTKEA